MWTKYDSIYFNWSTDIQLLPSIDGFLCWCRPSNRLHISSSSSIHSILFQVSTHDFQLIHPDMRFDPNSNPPSFASEDQVSTLMSIKSKRSYGYRSLRRIHGYGWKLSARVLTQQKSWAIAICVHYHTLHLICSLLSGRSRKITLVW